MPEMKTLTVDGKTYTVVDETARNAAASAQAAIPTKTSQLSNDSGFLTSAPVTSVNGKTGAVSLGVGDLTTGTFAGQVVANASGQSAGTSLLRNSKIVLTEENPTIEGEIVWVCG